MVCWRTTGFSSLRIENWDGEFTVFQPEAGKTHFLNEMGLKILSILDQSPATLDSLCRELSEYFTLPPDTHFSAQINRTLQRYEALGLVSRMKENA
ncbi:HPr-rel-A system PqqD family peptide chaperone [Betaproteobacteria bacterium PRO4]|uniref:HPr-rel-A system PqqD family peptide chaperone n=1 Tax=Nitrosomonas sp. TaxID=42353 RepID=UPI0025677BB5|nr:HPr-rel-A system PqqD family peptide chaperone [Nitrosomonas sp.]MDL1865948.1 HPr-rel-A system PqqD family peptide chaperone [Betaproteobacteria bacterium PRO4]